MMNTKELIEKLSQALSFKYPNDRMMPGITISHLRNGDFYVSLVRHNPEKTVIHKFQDPDLNVALEMVSRYLLESQVRELNPLDELNNALDPMSSQMPAWPCPDPNAYPPTVEDDDSWTWQDDSWGF